MGITIGIAAETASGEKRVALDPPTAAKLAAAGHTIRVQAGAGTKAGHPDPSWSECQLVDSIPRLTEGLQILPAVNRPHPEILDALPAGSLVLSQLAPHQDFEMLRRAAERGLSMIAMELVPRITRAQAMDVLSSQATVAGYQAVIIGADLSPRLMPMLTTAAGTLRPAKAVIIGAGVAGLQAIATARRLGAQVEAYDIRAAAREQVESLGARMIDTGVDAETEGGYARELTDDEQRQQSEALAARLARADLVICTAAIPGRPAPKIVTAQMARSMQPGSVIVDLAAESGGNCELTTPGENVSENGVLIAGPLNLPSRCALHASEMYARNIFNLMQLVIADGELKINRDDEVIAGCLLAHEGAVVHPKFKE